MAGSFSDYLEKELLDHAFGGADYSRPATLYVALYTAAPSDSGGGTEVSTSGTAYVRKDVTNNATNFPAASGTSPALKSNGTAITFAQATASWGTVVAFAIWDNVSAGNMLCWGDLSASKTIDAGDTPSFAIGELDITLD